jgi:hypothetical protein
MHITALVFSLAHWICGSHTIDLETTVKCLYQHECADMSSQLLSRDFREQVTKTNRPGSLCVP